MKYIREQVIGARLSQEERETHIYIEGQKAVMDSTIPRDYNRALKQNWEPVSVTKYEDGTVCGMVLTAPRKSITIRNAKPEKREMSEEQKQKIAAGLRAYREKSLKEGY